MQLTRPAGGHRRIQHKGHQGLRPSSRGEKFVYLDPAGTPSQISDSVHGLIDVLLLPVDFRYDSGDGASVFAAINGSTGKSGSNTAG